MSVDKNRAFSSSGITDTLIEFVNELGYPREVINLSNVTTNDMFQYMEGTANKSSIYDIWTQQAQGKKKRTLILIPSIRFTKLIIFHLQRLHNFHPRPESPLHLPTEETYTAVYYDAYLEKVAKHQRHLAGEEVSDPESPAPKPAKPTKQAKPKATKQPTVSKTTTKQPTVSKTKAKKPKPALAKPQEKKRKPVSESSEAPPLAKRAKAGKVVKKRTVKSSKQLVDEFVDEGKGFCCLIPKLEDTEEAILQKVLEESLTDAYPTQRGPLPPVVFRETDTGKLQPLPEVPGKGKEKVGEEQAAQVLLHLQTTKKKSPTEQYIFQRHTPVPSEPAGHEESSSLYAELGLSGSDTESDDEMPSVVRSGAQDEGQAGPNPDDVAESQPLPTPSVLAGPNLEHSDVEIAVSHSHHNLDFSYGGIHFIDDNLSEANYEENDSRHLAESWRPLLFRAAFKGSPYVDMKEILLQRMLEENYDKGHADRVAYAALQDSIRHDECEDFDVDKAQEETKKKKVGRFPKDFAWIANFTNLPPPHTVRKLSGSLAQPGSIRFCSRLLATSSVIIAIALAHVIDGQFNKHRMPQVPQDSASAEYLLGTTIWTPGLKPLITTILDDLYMDDETIADEQAYSSGEEVGRDHIPTVNLRQSWFISSSRWKNATSFSQISVDGAILQYNVRQATSLGGEPGHITIQSDFFFNKDLEYLRYGRKIGRPALSISKMKAAFYPDVGLEQLGQRFTLTGFSSEGDRTGRPNSQAYLKCRPNRSLLNVWTQLNLTKPRWDATGFEFKHDYTVTDSPRAVTFRDRYGVQMIMRFNEIHKFSDGTLQQIDEALDYQVKEFRVNRTNPGMNTRFWTKKDVVRSKAVNVCSSRNGLKDTNMKITKQHLVIKTLLYLTQAQRKQLALYCGHTIVKKHDSLTVIDTEDTLILAEESRLKMHAKQNDLIAKEKKINLASIDYDALNKLSEHFVPKNNCLQNKPFGCQFQNQFLKSHQFNQN
ncbi:hypothetical protein Tco_1256177 [Tanacetum coccineum]